MNSRIVEIFLELVKIDALSGAEKAVADYVRAFAKPYGLAVQEDQAGQSSGGNSGNLIIPVNGGGDMLLMAHMDTARPTRGIIPRIEKGRIVSGGNTILGADNRAGMAIILSTIETLLNGDAAFQPFTAVFTICEETTLAGSLRLKPAEAIQMAFVFDSSRPPGTFVQSGYGAQGFLVDIEGVASHSGVAPEKGVSAIQVAARAIDGLKLGRIDPQTTANIGRISGGGAINVIPAAAKLEGEIRSLSKERVLELADQFKTTFESAARAFGARSHFHSEWDFQPYVLTPDMPVVQRISSAIKRAKLEPIGVVSAGGSDANSLNTNAIPAVNIGIGAQNPHANDEFIMVNDLEKAAEIALALICI